MNPPDGHRIDAAGEWSWRWWWRVAFGVMVGVAVTRLVIVLR